MALCLKVCSMSTLTNVHKWSVKRSTYAACQYLKQGNSLFSTDVKGKSVSNKKTENSVKPNGKNQDLQHFRMSPTKSYFEVLTPNAKQEISQREPPIGAVTFPHPIWSDSEIHNVQVTHVEPEKLPDYLAYYHVKVLRKCFDIFSGYSFLKHTEGVWLNRIAFLETVAGVPGMVAAMARHLKSLRRMRRDHGWIHTLLEEAENERMHLMTALQLKQPSWFFRMAVIVTQGVFTNYFFLAYLVSQRYCHRFVGYLEEEAVYTYSKCLQDIENGPISHWKTKPAPDVAIRYWHLNNNATMKDVVLAIRADEAHHRLVNHSLASIRPEDPNPHQHDSHRNPHQFNAHSQSHLQQQESVQKSSGK